MNDSAPDDTRKDPLDVRIHAWLASAGKVLRYAAQRAGEKKLPQVAASLTYTTVLALVPLLAVVLALFTAFPLFADFKVSLEGFLTNSLMPPTVSETVMNYLNQFAAKASGLTAVGAAFLILTSILLIMTIDTALNDIWNVQRQRSMSQRMLVYWAIISLGPVLAGASIWISSYLAVASLDQARQISAWLEAALAFAPMVITGVGFAALFVVVPHRQVDWRDALAGGFGTAIVLELMRLGFTYYITRFPAYTVIYGAFATLPIFLLWIYLSWLAILFGATVAATLPSLRLRRWEANRQPGATFIDAIDVMRLLRRFQGSPSPGRSARFLSGHLNLNIDELLAVLNALRQLGYVVPTHDRGNELWVLACDARQADLGRVIDTLLIERNQLGLLRDPALLDAIAESLAGSAPVTLDQVLDEPGEIEPDSGQNDNQPLSQSGIMMQNNQTTTSKQNQETPYVESQ